MVSASYAPLLAVVLATVAGASALMAANAGLVVAMVLLTIHGWLGGPGRPVPGLEVCPVSRRWPRDWAGDDLAEGPGPGSPALTPFRSVQVSPMGMAAACEPRPGLTRGG